MQLPFRETLDAGYGHSIDIVIAETQEKDPPGLDWGPDLDFPNLELTVYYPNDLLAKTGKEHELFWRLPPYKASTASDYLHSEWGHLITDAHPHTDKIALKATHRHGAFKCRTRDAAKTVESMRRSVQLAAERIKYFLEMREERLRFRAESMAKARSTLEKPPAPSAKSDDDATKRFENMEL